MGKSKARAVRVTCAKTTEDQSEIKYSLKSIIHLSEDRGCYMCIPANSHALGVSLTPAG